jgi:hypothetical protein
LLRCLIVIMLQDLKASTLPGSRCGLDMDFTKDDKEERHCYSRPVLTRVKEERHFYSRSVLTRVKEERHCYSRPVLTRVNEERHCYSRPVLTRVNEERDINDETELKLASKQYRRKCR